MPSPITRTDKNKVTNSINMTDLSRKLEDVNNEANRLNKERLETKALLETKLTLELEIKPDDEDLYALQTKFKDLERKCALQSIIQQETMLELEASNRGLLSKQQKSKSDFDRELQAILADLPKLDRTHYNGITEDTTTNFKPLFRNGNNATNVDCSSDLQPMHKLLVMRERLLGGGIRRISDPSKIKDYAQIPQIQQQRVMVAKFDFTARKSDEISFKKGDYVIICGEAQQSGYNFGYSLDGSRGLIPSNHVETVNWNNTKQLATLHDSSVMSGFYCISEDPQHPKSLECNNLVKHEAYLRLNSDTFSIEEDEKEEEEEGKRVSDQQRPNAPRDIEILRQLTHSVLIAWKSPEKLQISSVSTKEQKHLLQGLASITSYHIYVDGQFSCSVKATEKSRALVKGVDIDKTHRISVRSVSSTGQSKDAECTMILGKGAIATPGRLKATQITFNSAKLSWLPGNSNYYHIVFLNDVEIKVCQPGIYKIMLTELPPDSSQRICVQAEAYVAGGRSPEQRNRRAPVKIMNGTSVAFDHTSLAAFIEFRTLPIGMPDPPTSIQIECGPQDGMVLVSWRPVPTAKIKSSTDSRAASLLPVYGYTVCLNAKTVTEVNGASADHVIVSFMDMAKVYRDHCQTVLSESNENPEVSELLRCLVTVHSIVPERHQDFTASQPKLIKGSHGPGSRPVNVPVTLFLSAAGCLETVRNYFGPILSQRLGFTEESARLAGVPFTLAEKQQELSGFEQNLSQDGLDEYGSHADNDEAGSLLTVAAGEAAEIYEDSRQLTEKESHAIDSAEALLRTSRVNGRIVHGFDRCHRHKHDHRYLINKRSRHPHVYKSSTGGPTHSYYHGMGGHIEPINGRMKQAVWTNVRSVSEDYNLSRAPRSRSVDGRRSEWSSNGSSGATPSPPRRSVIGYHSRYPVDDEWSDFYEPLIRGRNPYSSSISKRQSNHRKAYISQQPFRTRHPQTNYSRNHLRSMTRSTGCLANDVNNFQSSLLGGLPDVPQKTLPFVLRNPLHNQDDDIEEKVEDEDKAINKEDGQENNLGFLDRVKAKMEQLESQIKESADETRNNFEKSLAETRAKLDEMNKNNEERLKGFKMDLPKKEEASGDEEDRKDEENLGFFDRVKAKMEQVGEQIKESADETRNNFEKSLAETRTKLDEMNKENEERLKALKVPRYFGPTQNFYSQESHFLPQQSQPSHNFFSNQPPMVYGGMPPLGYPQENYGTMSQGSPRMTAQQISAMHGAPNAGISQLSTTLNPIHPTSDILFQGQRFMGNNMNTGTNSNVNTTPGMATNPNMVSVIGPNTNMPQGMGTNPNMTSGMSLNPNLSSGIGPNPNITPGMIHTPNMLPGMVPNHNMNPGINTRHPDPMRPRVPGLFEGDPRLPISQQMPTNDSFWNNPLASITKKFTTALTTTMGSQQPNGVWQNTPGQNQQRFGFPSQNNNTNPQSFQTGQRPFGNIRPRILPNNVGPQMIHPGGLRQPWHSNTLLNDAMVQEDLEHRCMRIFCAIFDYDPTTMSPNTDAARVELPFREGQLVKIFGDCDEDGFYMGECNGLRGLVPSNLVFELDIDDRMAYQNDLDPFRTLGSYPPRPRHIPPQPDYSGAPNLAMQRQVYGNQNYLLQQTGYQQGVRPGPETVQQFPVPNIIGPQPQQAPFMGVNSQISGVEPRMQMANRMNHQNDINGANTRPPGMVPPGPRLTGQPRRMKALYDYDPHVLSPNVDVEAELSFKVGEIVTIHGEMDEDGFYMGEKLDGRKGLVPSNFLQEDHSHDSYPQHQQQANSFVQNHQFPPNINHQQTRLMRPYQQGQASQQRPPLTTNTLNPQLQNRPPQQVVLGTPRPLQPGHA